MRAILLAAGMGTRLKPITDAVPKCLVEINGTPLLQIWFEKLSRAGVDRFLVNTHYLSCQVHEFIENSNFRDRVEIVNEPSLLGTAATLISNSNFLHGDDGLLIHADNYCLDDFAGFISAHNNRPSGCLMTMMTFSTDRPSDCGVVEVDNNVVTGFYEKVDHPPTNIANGAIYILSKDMIRDILINHPNALDFSNDIIGRYVGRILSYKTLEYFIDIGTVESYNKANSYLYD